MATTTVPQPRLPKAGSATQIPLTQKRYSIEDITSKGPGLPSRYLLYAPEKWGKSSLAAQFPKPIFSMTAGETGLLSLIDNGVIPETPHFPETVNWQDLLAQVQFLIDEDSGYKTYVIDTVNGAEKMCHEYVCIRDYDNDWSERGFVGFQRGALTSVPEWKKLLVALDRLRVERRMTILLLGHMTIGNFRNPTGPDFDKHQPDLHKYTWSVTNKWVDVNLFGTFDATVRVTQEKKDGTPLKGKAAGASRIIQTEGNAAFVAGSRMLRLPPEIDMGNSPKEGWENLSKAIKEARTKETTT